MSLITIAEKEKELNDAAEAMELLALTMAETTGQLAGVLEGLIEQAPGWRAKTALQKAAKQFRVAQQGMGRHAGAFALLYGKKG